MLTPSVFQEWVAITDLEESALPHLGPDLVIDVVAWMALAWTDKEMEEGNN